MKFEESNKILDQIKTHNKVYLNCHRGPDPDSIGSATALFQVISAMGKDVQILCPSDFPKTLSFVPFSDKIKKVDFQTFKFEPGSLFIVADSSSWDMVSGNKDNLLPGIDIAVIDHHHSNTKFGSINLVDDLIGSTCEILFNVFWDWNINIDKDIATSLLVGIIGDTGTFQYTNTTSDTFDIAKELMAKGAEKDKIIYELDKTLSYSLAKLWGKALSKMRIDKKGRFSWTALPFKDFEKLGKPEFARETISSLFAERMDGTDFGMVMIEQNPNHLSISLRSRTDVDSSLIALALGGGGHKVASGCSVANKPFKEAVKIVLTTARKYAKEYQAAKKNN